MRKSIATVSLSGTLHEKLAAVARAGFDGVEVFENDLINCPARPVEVRRWARDLGLTIDLYQPFRDLEAVAEEPFRRNLARAERKLDLMEQLGAATLLVCSNVSDTAIADDALAAAQLHALADRAAQHGVRVAYEALAWGRQVSDYRHAAAIVAAADHPHLGVCLDSFHILSRGDDPAGIAGIPGEKIFYLQLADAPRLVMDVLQWSRHYRCFPGQGGFDLAAFTEQVVAAGYRGPLSLEVFNDIFRQADATRTAIDAMRSLLYLEESLRARLATPSTREPAADREPVDDQRDEDQRDEDQPPDPRSRIRGRIELFDPPAPPPLDGYAFVELAVGDGRTAAAERLLGQLGFSRAGRHRSKPVTLWQQGDARVLLNAGRGHGGGSAQAEPQVELAALGIRSSDPARSANRAEALRAPVLPRRRGLGEVDLPTVQATDGTEVLFCGDDTWLGDFDMDGDGDGGDAAAGAPAPRLTRIDHVNLSLPFDQFDEAILFFRAVLGLQPRESVELADPYGLVRSRALTGDKESLRIALNVFQLRGHAEGPPAGGQRLQHVAFGCDDIIATTRALRAAGLKLLPVSDNYYDDLAARFEPPGDRLASLRELGLLYDRSPAGEYFHAYTEMLGDHLFFELVQRAPTDPAFGATNAPVRMAAQRASGTVRAGG